MNNINLVRKSLDHWLENLCLIENGCLPDVSSKSCALCNVYLNGYCLDCPLYHIGQGCCEEGSPYIIIENYFYKSGGTIAGKSLPPNINQKHFLKLALDMTQTLEFLFDVLEKGGE